MLLICRVLYDCAAADNYVTVTTRSGGGDWHDDDDGGGSTGLLWGLGLWALALGAWARRRRAGAA